MQPIAMLSNRQAGRFLLHHHGLIGAYRFFGSHGVLENKVAEDGGITQRYGIETSRA